MSIPLLILGAGGTAMDMLEIIADLNATGAKYNCVGLLDDDPALHGQQVNGARVLGPLEAARAFPDALVVDALGSPTNFWRRESITARLRLPPNRFASLIHPTAVIARSATIGAGTIVYPHCSIMAGVSLGAHVIVLANSVINHGTVIGDYGILASGVCISGDARVGAHCYLGAGCRLIQRVTIGERSLIGMGSVVVKDVAPNSVMVGNPAHLLRQTVEEC